jgi:predicted nucleic-acid-binding protein
MKALDTNVLARLLLKDDLTQFKKAQALLASDAQFTAPVTVMLELVWVLESNDCSPSEI